MKTILGLLTGIAGILLLVGCEKALPRFDSEQDRLNFAVEPKEVNPTPVRKTFLYDAETIVRDTVCVPVVAMGFVRDYDRYVSFEQIGVEPDSVYNAEPGVHYVSFDDEEVRHLMVLPAGQAAADIPVIVLRDPSIRDTLTVLKLRIKANDDFAVGDPDRVELVVEIGDIPVCPKRWLKALGDYGLEKHRFLIRYFGWRWDDETINMLTKDALYFNSVRTKAKKGLAEENKKRAEEGKGPLCEADGTIVKFP